MSDIGDRGAIAKIAQLHGVTWEWRDDAPTDAKDTAAMGIIAQDVERVFPALVHDGPDGIKRVEYHGLIAPLIEAVKELDARLRTLEEGLARDQSP